MSDEHPNVCPECKLMPTNTCRCMLGDSGCANGHKWYYCPSCSKKVSGESDHSLGSQSGNWCKKCQASDIENKVEKIKEQHQSQSLGILTTSSPLLAKGDVVRLKSGGPRMTVEGYKSGNKTVWCVWFCEGGKSFIRDEFNVNCLRLMQLEKTES